MAQLNPITVSKNKSSCRKIVVNKENDVENTGVFIKAAKLSSDPDKNEAVMALNQPNRALRATTKNKFNKAKHKVLTGLQLNIRATVKKINPP